MKKYQIHDISSKSPPAYVTHLIFLFWSAMKRD